jgi:saccharopine dehydrogenase-like NADP-dependent oxidoreductase
MPTQINKKVMILGADGLCGKSLLSILKRLYDIKDLILIDPSDESKPPIIIAKPESKDLWNVVSSMQMKKGDILIDLAPELPKLEVMQAMDSLGISVINATCCEAGRGTITLVDLLDKKLVFGHYEWQAPHIPDAGMNPGTINAILGAMVEYFGNPLDVTEWEMDSTIPYEWDGEGFATWSPEEFASEYCDESTWEVDGKKIMKK